MALEGGGGGNPEELCDCSNPQLALKTHQISSKRAYNQRARNPKETITKGPLTEAPWGVLGSLPCPASFAFPAPSPAAPRLGDPAEFWSSAG